MTNNCTRREFSCLAATAATALISTRRVQLTAAEPEVGVTVDAAEKIKPIPVPQWVQDAYRMTFTPPTTPEGWEQAAKDGLQVVFNLQGITGYTWYDGERFYYLNPGQTFKDAKTIDFSEFRKNVQFAHSHGIKVIGTMMPMVEYKVLDEHRDWQVLSAREAKPVDPYTRDFPPLGCYMSPFGEWYIKKNIEIMKATGWDGQNIDGFHTYVLCYCPACKAAYKKDANADIPPGTDPQSSEYRRFLRWRLEQWGKFVRHWSAELKKVNPEFAFTPWSTGPGRWWHWAGFPNAEGSELGNLMTDAPVLELFWDFPPNQGNNLLPTFASRFYRGFCQERTVWMAPYFRSQGQQQVVVPLVESEVRVLTVLTNGGVPPVAGFHLGKMADENYFHRLIRQREPWLKEARSVKWAAMLVSENSYLFYGIPGTRAVFGGQVAGSGVDSIDLSRTIPSLRRLPAHLESAIGMFRACMESHLPLDFISDLTLEQDNALEQYKVLALPDAACLSEKALANIRRFVQNGGGLVATQNSSLFDQDGNQRGDFGLADLFQAHFKGVEDHTGRWPQFPNTADFQVVNHTITDDPVIKGMYDRHRDQLNYIGWTAVVEADPAAQVIAHYSPYVNWLPKYEIKRPFILASPSGKGRVVYFAAAIDQAYFVSPYQCERPLMTNAIRWAAGECRPPVEVKAPMCVQAAFYEQQGGSRTVVHLLNELNTTGGRALPDMDPSMREEVVPLCGIKVLFRDKSIKNIKLQPEGDELKLNITDEGLEVVVPQLKLHSMVVADR